MSLPPGQSLTSTANPTASQRNSLGLPAFVSNASSRTPVQNNFSLPVASTVGNRNSLSFPPPPIMSTSIANANSQPLPNRTLPTQNQNSSNLSFPLLANQSLLSSLGQQSFSNLPVDKTSQIVSRWNLKFKGTSNDKLTIQEFLYRVSSRCHSDLRGDYQLLCNHISNLLEDKASNWFWRYHAEVQGRIIWMDLCAAMVEEFKDRRTDEDVMDKIRARKQKAGERFDSFYDEILRLNDRMVQRLSSADLLPIVKRNLHPDLRKDLLYLPIHTMSQLREYISKREIFDEDIAKHSSRSHASTRQVAEVSVPQANHESIEAFGTSRPPLKCWNCLKENHRWNECPSETRNLFCYGCGQPDVVQPKCPKCSGASKNSANPGVSQLSVLPPQSTTQM